MSFMADLLNMYTPFEKGGLIALHQSVCRLVGMSVGLLYLAQLITPVSFAPKSSNLVVRYTLKSR